jgi:bacillopeptidase F (M6 metalloprotease family)
MINFDIDGIEYTAQIVTLDQFEADHYDDAILAGAGFTGPDGQQYVVLAPKAAA